MAKTTVQLNNGRMVTIKEAIERNRFACEQALRVTHEKMHDQMREANEGAYEDFKRRNRR